MKRIFFLDDDYTRHGKFKWSYRNEDVLIVQAWDYSQAVEALRTEPAFDEAHLDHDLELSGIRRLGEATGFDVVSFIVTLPEHQRPREIIVHSWNEMGRLRMREMLVAAGISSTIRPFGGGP